MKTETPKNRMRPIHPGEILREEFMAPLGLSASSLAVALRIPAPRINDVVREKRAVSVDTALRLARYFSTSPQFWMNLQTAFDLKVGASRLADKINQEVQPAVDPEVWTA